MGIQGAVNSGVLRQFSAQAAVIINQRSQNVNWCDFDLPPLGIYSPVMVSHEIRWVDRQPPGALAAGSGNRSRAIPRREDYLVPLSFIGVSYVSLGIRSCSR